jgi:Phosphodiesterase/alkaline phosphatase D
MNTFKAADPDKIKFILSLTMTLEEWRMIRDQIKTSVWPAGRVREEILSMIEQAEKTYYPQYQPPKEE